MRIPMISLPATRRNVIIVCLVATLIQVSVNFVIFPRIQRVMWSAKALLAGVETIGEGYEAYTKEKQARENESQQARESRQAWEKENRRVWDNLVQGWAKR